MQKSKTKRLNIMFESEIETRPVHANHHEQSQPAKNKKNRTKGKTGEFIALASIPVVLVLGNSMLIPVLPDMQKALKITQMQTSFIITLFSLTAGLFIPIIGYLSDRFTRKAIILISLSIYGGAGIVAGFAAIWESYPLILVARAIQGLGAAGTAPISMALIGDMYKGGTESQALGLSEAANGTGKVLSPMIGALLALIVWYAAFFAFPLFCLLSIIAVMWLIKEPKKKKKPLKLGRYIHTIIAAFKKKGRWLFTAFFAGSLALFILFGVLFFLSEILEKKPYHITGFNKGWVLAIPLLGLVATSYTTGTLIKKNGQLMRWLMNIGLAITTLSLAAAIFFNHNIYVFISLLTLSCVGTGLLLPCLNTMITGAVATNQRGMITSLYSSLRFLGVAFGPPLFSWLMDISHRLVFITVSSLSLLSLGLVFFLIKPEKKIA